MKSYEELLLEMLKPLTGDQMLKKIQRRYPDSFLQDDRFNDTANTIVIRCADDDLARKEFFGDDEEENERNKEKLNKLLSPYHWYVTQTNNVRQSIIIQQRDVNDIANIRTYDPADYLDNTDSTELIPNFSDIKQYGFIHVSPVAPSTLLRTGIRAKNSGTFDKHDEKRIYLFSLAPQYVTDRPDYHELLSNSGSGGQGLKALSDIMSDEGTMLNTLICQFVEARNEYFKDDEDKIKYVYFIKNLQKPAKLYKDNAWTDLFTLDAMYTKDYNILPGDITYLGTIDQLESITRRELNNTNVPSSRRDTAVGEINTPESIDEDDLEAMHHLYYANIHARRVVNLAINLLSEQYGIDASPKEVCDSASKIIRYLYNAVLRLESKIDTIQSTDDLTEKEKRLYVRRVYATVADPVVAAVLKDKNYGKTRTQR
jgi:hypothetical protein